MADFTGSFMTAMVEGLNPMNRIAADFASGNVQQMKTQTADLKRQLIKSMEADQDDLIARLDKHLENDGNPKITALLERRIASIQQDIEDVRKL